jgi:hypothetical protein
MLSEKIIVNVAWFSRIASRPQPPWVATNLSSPPLA